MRYRTDPGVFLAVSIVPPAGPAGIGFLSVPEERNEMIQATPTAADAPALRFDTSDTGRPRRERDLTLLDVIEAIQESTDDLAEATVVFAALLRSGTVRRREAGC